MEYYQLNIKTKLKAPIHFQKAPEVISKLISTALINSGYKSHNEKKPKNYVFSNLGKANENGIYKKEGIVSFRSFKKDLIKQVYDSLMFYEDNIFEIENISFKKVEYKPIKTIVTLNPVFVVLKKSGIFWTFNKTGEMISLFDAIAKNLVRKYETSFDDKIDKKWFSEYVQVINNKPFTYYYKGVKFFGYKFYIHPKDDEISQKLAFTAIATGLGHKNSSVGGGYCKWQDVDGRWYY